MADFFDEIDLKQRFAFNQRRFIQHTSPSKNVALGVETLYLSDATPLPVGFNQAIRIVKAAFALFDFNWPYATVGTGLVLESAAILVNSNGNQAGDYEPGLATPAVLTGAAPYVIRIEDSVIYGTDWVNIGYASPQITLQGMADVRNTSGAASNNGLTWECFIVYEIYELRTNAPLRG